MKAFSVFVFAVFLVGSVTYAAVSEIVQNRRADYEAFYKDLHQNPELSGHETRTAGKVAEEFRKLGLEVKEKIGGTGVVGIMKNGAGPVTLIRAELDALPVPENTSVPYASQVPGVMHACGHDFHLMSLVGAAQVMNETKSDWSGTLVFLAQPAEETISGARAMISDGVFKKIPKPDQFLAIHTSGLLKARTFGITSGYAMAASDSIDVVFKGKGTHGSLPENGIDPFVQAAEFVLKMLTLVGREKRAFDPAVLSVGSIHGGAKSNIIPEEVKLQLTLRTFDPELRKKLKARVVEIAQAIAQANRAPKPVVTFPEGTDVTFNTPALAARVKNILVDKLGAAQVLDSVPVMGGEDFGYFGAEVKAPSLLIWVGQKNVKNPNIVNHSPKYLPDLASGPFAITGLSHVLMDLHKKASDGSVRP